MNTLTNNQISASSRLLFNTEAQRRRDAENSFVSLCASVTLRLCVEVANFSLPIIAALLVGVVSFSASAAGLPHAKPEAAGMDSQQLARIDEIVAQGLAEKRMPGCVVCVGRQG